MITATPINGPNVWLDAPRHYLTPQGEQTRDRIKADRIADLRQEIARLERL